MADHEVIATELADVARQLEAEQSPIQTWRRISDLAVATIDGCEYAGIALVRAKRIQTAAATHELVEQVDAIQYDTNEGPCLASIREHATLVVDDLTTEERWPLFSRRAVQETGIRSVLAFQLFVRGDTLGALNLYSRAPGAFGEQACSVGALFAAHAALAMSNAQEHEHAEQLEKALDSSRIIGLALGIVMQQSDVDRHRAFAILSAASQRQNVKLRDLAEAIVGAVEARVR